jgi:N-acetylmuramoyl-L-alanine amidase
MRLPHLLISLALLALLAGCITTGQPTGERQGAHVDGRIEALGQSSRVKHLVLHYTATNLNHSTILLTRAQVSAHYLVTDERPPRILQLVDESRNAWHAGLSVWFNQVNINPTSIGIEIVNYGDAERALVPGLSTDRFQPFPPAQMARTAALATDIIRRHGIAHENIVAHSDIAPQRKHDPGPLFPWRELAEQGIGRWFDETMAAQAALTHLHNGVPAPAWFQAQLARIGYDVPRHGRWDGPTRQVLAMFQMHYRPATYDGLPDAVTAGILAVLPTHGTALGPPRLTEPPLGVGTPSASTLGAWAALAQRVTPALVGGPSAG